MSNLTEIQNKLKNFILGSDEQLDFIKSNKKCYVDLAKVHRDTVLDNFVNSLKIMYPGVWQLIGEDCARGAALVYSHDYNNLTNRSNMGEFGNNFPQFLFEFSSTKHLQYLKDYAQLELLRSRSYEAISQESMNIEELQQYFDRGIESCKLLFNTSIFFLDTKFPLMEIQNLLDSKNSEELLFKRGQFFIMICRVGENVETISLPEKQWNFLKDIKEGKIIGSAMEIFTEQEITAEMPALIWLMIGKQMISKILE